MFYSPQDVKDTLFKLVSEMQDNSWLYTKNPKNYTRYRKISFSDAVLSTISMQKSSSKAETLKYFDFSSSSPTSSALIQQREKLSANTFETLFYDFTSKFPCDQTYKGYDPIAVDGSDIYIPRNPKDPETYRISDKYGKGFNMIHLNSAFHLLNHLYLDAILQPVNQINEYLALCDMIDRFHSLYPERKPLFICDRGYVALNVFSHAIENDAYFLIRAREAETDYSTSMLSTLQLPDTPEFDIIFERWLTRRKTKVIKAEPEIYKSIRNRIFDYLEPHSKSLYYICFRIVRFKLPNGSSETIYTNLPREDFTNQELQKLYHMRWGIETSFRDIKYAAGMLYFHSRKKELVIHEIYAKLILYNFCEIITGSIAQQKKTEAYIYRINFALAIAICTEYLRRRPNSPPVDVAALISRELIPERPGRSNPRYIRARTATTFQYR